LLIINDLKVNIIVNDIKVRTLPTIRGTKGGLLLLDDKELLRVVGVKVVRREGGRELALAAEMTGDYVRPLVDWYQEIR
jgi:hypothetical protein